MKAFTVLTMKFLVGFMLFLAAEVAALMYLAD